MASADEWRFGCMSEPELGFETTAIAPYETHRWPVQVVISHVP